MVFDTLGDVADEAFARGDDDVGFEPERALDFEPAGFNLGADAGEQLGIILFEIIEQHALIIHEAVVVIFVHQGQGIGHGTRHFLAGFADAPEPGNVDMGVAGGDDLGHGIGVGLGIEGVGAGAGGFETCGKALGIAWAQVDEVDCFVDMAEEPGSAGVVGFEKPGDV